MDKTRMNYLLGRFVAAEQIPEDDIDSLTLEELSLIYAYCEGVDKSEKKDPKLANINYAIREQIIYWAAVEKIKNADEIFVVYTKMPLYPYLDPNGSAWIFSTEETGRHLVEDFKQKQYLGLVLRKIEKGEGEINMIEQFFNALFFIGADRVVLDNGSHPIPFTRTDIYEDPKQNPDRPGQNFNNRALQRSMIQFFQYMQLNVAQTKASQAEGLSEEQKQKFTQMLDNNKKVLGVLETRMLSGLVDAKFLVPSVNAVDGKNLKPGETAPEGAKVEHRIANLMDKDKQKWIPAFTDWPELAKLYRPDQWGAMVVPYETVVKLARDSGINQIVFNARGEMFRVNEKLIGNIENFRAKKAEFEQKRAEEKKDAEEAETASAGKKGKAKDTPKNAPEAEPVKSEQPKPEAAPKAAAAEASSDAKPVYGPLEGDTPEMMVMALKRTAKALKNVQRLWLAGRTEKGREGYLVVVESADYSRAAEELKKAAAGYLDGRDLEIENADEEFREVVADLKPVYKKGIFG
ncbi:MAG: SseB family protein [Lachnospiraceae bacterium]|jgi:hypothetical protein